MDCEEAWNLISARMDGETASGTDPGLEAHLAVCADCRAVEEAFKVQDSDLRRAFVPRRKAAHIVADRAVGDLRPPGGRGHARNFLVIAAAAAAGFAIAALVFRTEGKPAAPPRSPDLVAAPAARVATSPPEEAVKVPPASLARLALSTGLVEMLVGEAWVPVPTGGEIQAGTRLRTGPEVLCEFHTPDGSEVRLNSSTEASFLDRRRLELTRGRMWSSVKKDETAFEVRVPEATVTAVGTKFDLKVEPTATMLTVVEGTTKVTGKAGVDYVGSGFRAKITGEGVVSDREGEILRATSWVNKILVLKGPDNPELADRLLDLLAYVGEGKLKFLAESELLELGESCVRPLLSYVLSQRSRVDPDRRLSAMKIACKLATKPAVPELIQLLPDGSRDVRALAAEALARITGETQGRKASDWQTQPFSVTEATYKKWLVWWDAHRAEYVEGGDSPQKTK
jgi:ferric-dicitrate binding protein FerR (iron transport regulator)